MSRAVAIERGCDVLDYLLRLSAQLGRSEVHDIDACGGHPAMASQGPLPVAWQQMPLFRVDFNGNRGKLRLWQ